MASRQEEQYLVTKITRTIPKPFDEVVKRLRSSIRKQGAQGLGILKSDNSKQAFEEATNASLGPHEFMEFASISHNWMHLYGVHKGQQALRIVFGNPQIAVTMIEHDVNAGLFVPVEVLLVECKDSKGTEVVQIKPSTLIAGPAGSTAELRAAAEKLDEKLDKLWEFVAADE